MGCIFLELVTRLLEGAERLERFTHNRTAETYDGIYADIYYLINVAGGGVGVGARVRKWFVGWIQRLRTASRHSEMVPDFLYTSEKVILATNFRSRTSEESHHTRIKEIFFIRELRTRNIYLELSTSDNKSYKLL